MLLKGVGCRSGHPLQRLSATSFHCDAISTKAGTEHADKAEAAKSTDESSLEERRQSGSMASSMSSASSKSHIPVLLEEVQFPGPDTSLYMR